jgi:hypothetical protein
MWSIADRIVKTMSDVTIGTVIVLVHVALAERQSQRIAPVSPVSRPVSQRASRHATRVQHGAGSPPQYAVERLARDRDRGTGVAPEQILEDRTHLRDRERRGYVA